MIDTLYTIASVLLIEDRYGVDRVVIYMMRQNNQKQDSYSLMFCRLDLEGKIVRDEPKGIVPLSKLLLLFQFSSFPVPLVLLPQTQGVRY